VTTDSKSIGVVKLMRYDIFCWVEFFEGQIGNFGWLENK
jgi:hypothetical protein